MRSCGKQAVSIDAYHGTDECADDDGSQPWPQLRGRASGWQTQSRGKRSRLRWDRRGLEGEAPCKPRVARPRPAVEGGCVDSSGRGMRAAGRPGAGRAGCRRSAAPSWSRHRSRRRTPAEPNSSRPVRHASRLAARQRRAGPVPRPAPTFFERQAKPGQRLVHQPEAGGHAMRSAAARRAALPG